MTIIGVEQRMKLWEFLKHGDDIHQAWLFNAIEAFFAGRPRPSVDHCAFEVGDYVEKFSGEARWFGTVVAKYNTLRGAVRYVVEIDPQGFQMITNDKQIRKVAIGQEELEPVSLSV